MPRQGIKIVITFRTIGIGQRAIAVACNCRSPVSEAVARRSRQLAEDSELHCAQKRLRSPEGETELQDGFRAHVDVHASPRFVLDARHRGRGGFLSSRFVTAPGETYVVACVSLL